MAGFHLLQRMPYFFRICRRQHVAWLHHVFGFNEHAVTLLGERNQVSFPQFQRLANLARNDDLAPLSHAAARLSDCGGCLGAH